MLKTYQPSQPQAVYYRKQRLYRVGDGTRHKNVTAFDYNGVTGYLVRVRWAKQSASRLFTVKKYGTHVLAEALAWRNETEQRLGKPRTERRIIAMEPSRWGKELPIGISEEFWGRRRGETYRHRRFKVTYPTAPGKTSATSFSITKYGRNEALRRAVAFRKQRLDRYLANE